MDDEALRDAARQDDQIGKLLEVTQNLAETQARHDERLSGFDKLTNTFAEALDAVVKRIDRFEKLFLISIVVLFMTSHQGQQLITLAEHLFR